MSKPIIVLRSKKFMWLKDLDQYRQLFLRQMQDGLLVVPDYFEVSVINAEQLDCEIEEVENE